MIKEKITKRIQALRAKTIENGATRQEMEAALEKANQLMIEFYITEHDLSKEIVEEKCVLKSHPLTPSGYYMGYFYNELATLFDCEYFFNSGRNSPNTITFFGFSSDVELCIYFYTLITKTCLQEKDRYLKSKEAQILKYDYSSKTIAASFIRGFLIKIGTKLQQLYAERESSIPTSTGLMVIQKKEKVQNEFQAMDFSIKTRKSKQQLIAEEAYDDGENEAENFKLSQGINGEEVKEAAKLTVN